MNFPGKNMATNSRVNSMRQSYRPGDACYGLKAEGFPFNDGGFRNVIRVQNNGEDIHAMITLLFLALIAFLASSIKPLLHPRHIYYQTFYLNPDVDWTKPEVQEAWNRHGVLVGKFLSEETPLALVELLVLCNAYIVQHGNPYKQPFSYSILDYELQILFESSIVIVTEWKAFPTSPTRVHSPLRIPNSPYRQSTYTSLLDEETDYFDE